MMERIPTRFGMPFITTSTGLVTCASSSSGGRPGACMATSTWVGETSGKASIGSFR